MKLVDKNGNEISSRNEKIEKIESEFYEILGDTHKEAIRKLELAGVAHPEVQNIILEMSKNLLLNLLLFSIVDKLGVSVTDLLDESELETTKTRLNNVASQVVGKITAGQQGSENPPQQPN